jgi:hypothetical protein
LHQLWYALASESAQWKTIAQWKKIVQSCKMPNIYFIKYIIVA